MTADPLARFHPIASLHLPVDAATIAAVAQALAENEVDDRDGPVTAWIEDGVLFLGTGPTEDSPRADPPRE